MSHEDPAQKTLSLGGFLLPDLRLATCDLAFVGFIFVAKANFNLHALSPAEVEGE